VSRVWRFEVGGTVTASGVSFLSHVHYQTDVPVGEGEPSGDTVLDAIIEHYSSSGHNMSQWIALMGSNAKLLYARVREELAPGDDDPPLVAEETLNLQGALTPTADLPPTPMCAWLKFTTGQAGRSFRGGTHTPPIPTVTPLTVDGTIDVSTGTWGDAIEVLAASILDKLENVFSATGDINPGVYSRTRRGRGQSFFTELDAVTPSNVARWLRRRMTAP